MSVLFLLLVFLATHACYCADKDPASVPFATEQNYFASNIAKSENVEFNSTDTETPTSAERTSKVVTDASSFFPDGKSLFVRFIPALSSDCRRLMEEYASFSSNFMQCALLHAKPLLLCERCVAQYRETEMKFREIEKSECGGSLLSSDRVQIVRESHAFVTNLWKKGNCGSCFKDVQHCNPSHIEDCKLTEKVAKFQQYSNETLECFRAADVNDYDVCTNCSSIYSTLSKFYGSMGHVEEICMDCVELMNSTRKEWSIMYNCTCTRKDVVSIVAISVFFCSLPLFFYIGSKMHTVKTEHKLMKQNRLRKTPQRPRPKLAPLPEQGEAYLTNDSLVNSI